MPNNRIRTIVGDCSIWKLHQVDAESTINGPGQSAQGPLDSREAFNRGGVLERYVLIDICTAITRNAMY